MTRTATLAAALLLGASSLAMAQTGPTTSPSSKSPATTSGSSASGSGTHSATPGASSSGSVTGSAGSSLMSEADIKKHLEQQGYSQVQLRDDTSTPQKGDWNGTAMKGGKQVNIHVDSSGKVTER